MHVIFYSFSFPSACAIPLAGDDAALTGCLGTNTSQTPWRRAAESKETTVTPLHDMVAVLYFILCCTLQ